MKVISKHDTNLKKNLRIQFSIGSVKPFDVITLKC